MKVEADEEEDSSSDEAGSAETKEDSSIASGATTSSSVSSSSSSSGRKSSFRSHKHIHEEKSVTFGNTLKVVLIPTREEYRAAADLDQDLWWRRSDLVEFKAGAAAEIYALMMGAKVSLPRARLILYQPMAAALPAPTRAGPFTPCAWTSAGLPAVALSNGWGYS